MSENNKNNAQYVGNKVKVRVTKKSARSRRVRVSDLSPGAMANRNAQPIDITPVDYQPPKPADKDLQSIRDAGYREGRKLSVKSVQTETKPDKAETAVKSETPKAKPDVAAKPKTEEKRKAKQPETAKVSSHTKSENAEPQTSTVSPDAKTDDKKTEKTPAAASSAADNRNAASGNAPETERKDDPQREAPEGKESEAKEKDGGLNTGLGFDAASGREKKKKRSGKAEKTGHGTIDDKEKSGTQDGEAGGKVRKRPTVPRTMVLMFSGLLMLYSLSPLAVGVFTLGIIPPFCIGAFVFAVAYFWPKICACRKPWFNALFLLVGIVVLAGVTAIFYLFGQMYAASAVKPPAGRSDYTVVVLGCKTIGNRPSLMLEDRLDAAADFLKAHPGAYCVVSGGQGEDELAPESVIMKKYLVSKGISELRIVEERRSTNTEENIAYSCALLDECNLYSDIVVVTDRFHQYRARHYLTQRGLRCYAVNSETRWYLAMHYWFKEMVAVAMLEMGMKIR